MSEQAVNVEGTKRALDDYLRALELAAADSMAEALQSAEDAARLAIHAQTKQHTGELDRALAHIQLSAFRGKVFNTAPYARWVDEGTKPHTIRAHNAKFLRFESGGQIYFRRQVNHPGTAPRPFVAIAQAAGQMALRDGLQQRADKAAADFNR